MLSTGSSHSFTGVYEFGRLQTRLDISYVRGWVKTRSAQKTYSYVERGILPVIGPCECLPRKQPSLFGVKHLLMPILVKVFGCRASHGRASYDDSLAVHRCVFIEEIFREIVEFAYRIPDVEVGRRTVASLNLTCRAFHPVGEEILWSHLLSLRPLIKCFPKDTWKERTEKGFYDQLKITLTRPSRPSEWNHFRTKAAHVKALYLGILPTYPILAHESWSVFAAAISEVHSPPCILPNLEKLRWGHTPLDYINLFTGPRLRDVRLLYVPASTFDPILRSFVTGCPSLEHINVKLNQFGHQAFTPDFVPAISKLEGLKSIQIDSDIPTSTEAILHLAQRNNLHVAEFFCPNDGHFSTPLLSAGTPRFTTLRTLYVRAKVLDDSTAALLRSISSPALQEVTFSTAVDTSDFEISNHLDILCNLPGRDTLTTISLSFPWSQMVLWDEPPNDDNSRHSSALQTLRPLLECHNLVNLEIQSDSLKVDHATIEAIAIALPKLEILYLTPVYPVPNRISRVTLDGILPLFEHCRNLRYLGLAVDARCPIRPENFTRQMPSSGLVAFNVADSVIIKTAANSVAAFLSMLFTRLDIRIYHEIPQVIHQGTRDTESERLEKLHWQTWQDVERSCRSSIAARTESASVHQTFADPSTIGLQESSRSCVSKIKHLLRS
ncbi:hypothetical protein A0H81_12530 [Grifola frondosa]|uniref:F-box domain-containing protein n=1 Tax=Grifola frondosa TaxID=5627 RepID=A0A1C7LS19_GRIFR|nr:hypothetical protein A0H81_12530 [Grifola frondosa]